MVRRVAVLSLFGVLLLAGTTTAGTITVPAGGNLQQAINQAQPGDTILLAAGATYTGNFTLPAKNGSSYITIRSNAPDSSLPAAGQRITPDYASQLPKLQAPAGGGGTPALATAPSASYYIIEFVEFLPNPSGTGSLLALGSAESSQNSLSVVPHDIIVDRCYLHSYPGVPQLRGIALNSAKTTIQNSYISEMKYAGLDSQAIAGWNGPGPYTIVNNYMQAAGENFMLGGSTMFIPNTTPTNIQFRNNYLTKDPAWRGSSWTVKNIFELKHAQDVVVDGNVFEYIWVASQPGYAIVVTPRNQYGDNLWTIVQRVTFTNNLIRHVSSAFNILGWDNEHPSQQTNHLTFRNNVLEDVSAANWAGDGRMMLISQTPYVTVDHNTALNSGSALYAYNGPSDNFVFTNNIANTSYYGIIGDSSGTGNAAIATYFPGSTFAGNVFVACPSAATYPAGNNYVSTYQGVGFVDLSGGDYHLSSSSPYKGKATDGSDPGANIDTLKSALAASTPTSSSSDTTSPAPNPTPTPTPAPSGSLPSPWGDSDIGSVGIAGSASYGNGTFTVNGAGSDIWDSADSFHYVYQLLAGDGQIVARVLSLQNTNTYAKAGVMIRGSLAAGSAQATVDVKPGGGIEFLSRVTTAGATTDADTAGTAPVWVKLVRAGNAITAYSSADGTTWTQAGKATVTMASTVYVGLAVTSHTTGQLNAAAFDNVAVSAASSTSASVSTPTQRAALTDADVGAVGLAGSASFANGVYTVKGAGSDIWDTADSFNFDYQPLAGDGQIVVRVTSLQNTNPYAKAGVMIRETTGAASANVLVDVMAGGGLELVARASTGASTAWKAGGTGSAPVWLKLVRAGSTFTAYSSANGSTWTTVGSVTVSMSTTVYVGLAVCSHNSSAMNTATFDSLSIGTVSAQTTTTATAYADADIGAVGIAGSASFSNGVYTVKGAGSDIWDAADSFNFVYVPLAGNGQVVARVKSLLNTSSLAKAGVMIREALGAGAVHAVLDVAPTGGVEFVSRRASGGSTSYVAGTGQAAPLWLKLMRSGTTITAYTSKDGATWSAVGNVSVSMATNVYVGLVVCSHNTSALNTATFDNWSVQ